MSISEKIMDTYERAIKERDHKCLKHTKAVLAYLACRTNKDFCELSDSEVARYMDELLISDVLCDEYSGIDECEDENYRECRELFECFTEM